MISPERKLPLNLQLNSDENGITAEHVGIDVDLDSDSDSDSDFDLSTSQEELETISDDLFDDTLLYMKEVSRFEPLTATEEKMLFAKIVAADKNSQAAKELFIKKNLRLVISIARLYLKNGVPLADLVQDGNLGLLKAVEKFDPSLNFKFSTYATTWIKAFISRGIKNKERLIRIPIHEIDKIHAFKKQVQTMTDNLGYQPTIGEIAQATGLSPKKITLFFKLLDQEPVSLDHLNGAEDAEENYFEFLSQQHLSYFDEDSEEGSQLDKTELRTQLKDAVLSAKLTDPERFVLVQYFGFEPGVIATESVDGIPSLIEIGKFLNISRQRAHKINQSALYKLRKYLTANRIDLSIYLAD